MNHTNRYNLATQVNATDMDMHDLIKQANDSLYLGKRSGKDKVAADS